MVAIIAGSLVALGLTGAMNVLRTLRDGGGFGFRDLCR